ISKKKWLTKAKAPANATNTIISASILVEKILLFLGSSVCCFIFFPPPVLPGSGSKGRQQTAVLSARSFSQLPHTLSEEDNVALSHISFAKAFVFRLSNLVLDLFFR